MRRALGLVLAFVLAALWAGCAREDESTTLDRIRQRGELVVLTRNAPTTYYEGRGGFEGIEYDMVAAFARSLGVKPRFVVLQSVTEILDALGSGQADLAAAGLTRTQVRSDSFRFGLSYQKVKQQLVCRRGSRRPRSLSDMAGIELRVVARSSYVERLKKLRREHPELVWTTDAEAGTEDLLESVWNKEIACTVSDNNILAINRRYFPELVVAFDLSEPEPLAWLLPKDAEALQGAIEKWFAKYKKEDLRIVLDKYYGFVQTFDWVDTREFGKRIASRLPLYEASFRAAADEYGIRWTLLASMAYQESHWNPEAVSPTGVAGIMMLTNAAAADVGVADRLDPSESILGGTRYLLGIRERLPDSIREPDRTWIALAAYNVGMGHLRDARTLAAEKGRDPDRWVDLAEVLPLLAKKRYYRNLAHGYARGREPVAYVNRIRHYEDILIRRRLMVHITSP